MRFKPLNAFCTSVLTRFEALAVRGLTPHIRPASDGWPRSPIGAPWSYTRHSRPLRCFVRFCFACGSRRCRLLVPVSDFL